MKRTFLIFLLFLISLVPVFSQVSALVLTYVNIKDSSVKKETEEQIRKQITKELLRQNLSYLDRTAISSQIDNNTMSGINLIAENSVYALGKAAGVPVVLTVEAVDKENFLEFIITAWDMEGEKKISSDRKVSRSSVTRYVMINSSINFVVSTLTGEYGAESISIEPKVKKITFISNQDGLQIFTKEGEYLGEITHSVLIITDRVYDLGTTMYVKKKLENHRTEDQYILLDKVKSFVTLSDLDKATTIALEFNWTYPQLMGLGTGLRYYAVPDWMFVSFDTHFYLQKDFTTAYGNETVHNDLRLLVGTYFIFGPTSIFRVNASLGAGVILSYPIDRPGVYYDTYINLINLSFELNLSEWSFYLRPELKLSLGIGDSSLLDGGFLLSDVNLPGITLGVLRKW